MRNAIETLLGLEGIDRELAEIIISKGYTLTKIKNRTKKELGETFGQSDGDKLYDATKRKTISKDVVHRIIEECNWTCCRCQDLDSTSSVQIHHIKPHAKKGRENYDNLMLLCPNCHDHIHKNRVPEDQQKQLKSEWTRILKEWKSGERSRPGRKTTLSNDRPYIFPSLDEVFSRDTGFLPRSKLFEKDLLYFLPEEQDIIDSITALFTSQQERFCVISGPPCSGKTTISLTIGTRLNLIGKKAFYANITGMTSFADLWNDIASLDCVKGKSRGVVIIDNCHLNIELANSLYSRFQGLTSVSCLIVMRSLPPKIRINEDSLGRDFIGPLEDDQRHYRLDGAISNDNFSNKADGILEKYEATGEVGCACREYVESLGGFSKALSNSFIRLISLIEIFSKSSASQKSWKKELSEIVWNNYLERLKKDQRDLLLYYCEIFQYEAPICVCEDEAEFAKGLSVLGYFEFDDFDRKANIYHPYFARMLLDSYTERAEFRQKYRSPLSHEIEIFTRYVKNTSDIGCNIDEVMDALFRNNKKKIYIPLIDNHSLNTRIVRAYARTNNIQRIIRYLQVVKRDLSLDKFKSLGDALVLSNKKILWVIQKHEEPLLMFVLVLRALYHKNIKHLRNQFLSYTDDNYIESLLRSTSLAAYTSALDNLSRIEARLQKRIINLTADDWIKKVTQYESVDTLTSAVRRLSVFDRRYAKKIFNEILKIQIDVVPAGSRIARFSHLADTLNKLNRFDVGLTNKLLRNISYSNWHEMLAPASIAAVGFGLSRLKDIDFEVSHKILGGLRSEDLIEKSKNTSIVNLSNALTELYSIDKIKTSQIFENISLHQLSGEIEKCNFVHIGKVLSELSVISKRKTRNILFDIRINLLVEKSRYTDFKGITKTINELAKIDRKKTKDILCQIDSEQLNNLASSCPIEGLGRSLCELSYVDVGRAKYVFNTLEDKAVKEKLNLESIVQVGHTLSELAKVDIERAKGIFALLDKESLAKRITFENVGLLKTSALLNQFNKVSSDDTVIVDIASRVPISALIELARRSRFDVVAVGLQGIAKFNPETPIKVLSALGVEWLSQQSRDVPFEKYSRGLEGLSKLDRNMAVSVARSLDIETVVNRAHLVSFERLIDGLSLLGQYDPEYAKQICESIGTKMLVEKAAKGKKGMINQAIDRIKSFAPDISKELLYRSKYRNSLKRRRKTHKSQSYPQQKT